MKREDVEAAMISESPVIYNGIRYDRIIEYVLWFDKRRRRKLSVVLMDRTGNCTVRAPIEKVELEEAL